VLEETKNYFIRSQYLGRGVEKAQRFEPMYLRVKVTVAGILPQEN
jgi:hypothetical protein